MNKIKGICLDCGSVPANHFLKRLEARVDHYLLPAIAPVEKIAVWLGPLFQPIGNKVWPRIIKILVKLRWVEVKLAPDEKNNWRSRALWDEAKERGIEMREIRPFGRYIDSYFAEFNGKIIFFDGLPRPTRKRSATLDWMDDKAKMAARFCREDIPVASGDVAKTEDEAIKIFHCLEKPVVVKPVTGSRGRHTTIHINTNEELRHGFTVAKQLSPWVVVQEELSGSVYRATVIGGKLIAVLRRDPACVIGDGARTVKQLLEEENKNPLRQGPLFHHLQIDGGAKAELKHHALRWGSIPIAGRIVALGVKTSRSAGGALTDVTDIVHPANNELFEKIGTMLDDSLIGIDFIIADIKKSWQEQSRCGVIECNSLPFIDLHHYPSQGKPRNVAGAVWDIIFPEPRLG